MGTNISFSTLIISAAGFFFFSFFLFLADFCSPGIPTFFHFCDSVSDRCFVRMCVHTQGWHGTYTIRTPTPSSSDANDLYLARGSSAKPLNVRLRSRQQDCCFSKVPLLVCGKVPASFSRCPHLVPLKGF